MELFCMDSRELFLQKSSNLDIWLGSEYAIEVCSASEYVT